MLKYRYTRDLLEQVQKERDYLYIEKLSNETELEETKNSLDSCIEEIVQLKNENEKIKLKYEQLKSENVFMTNWLECLIDKKKETIPLYSDEENGLNPAELFNPDGLLDIDPMEDVIDSILEKDMSIL